MADTQIDELRLDITVEDNSKDESSSKKIRSLASAISRLNGVLDKFDNVKFAKVFKGMTDGVDPFIRKIKGASSALANLATIITKTNLKKLAKDVETQAKEISAAGEEQKAKVKPKAAGTGPEGGGTPNLAKEQLVAMLSYADNITGRIGALTYELKLAKGELASFVDKLKQMPQGTAEFNELAGKTRTAAKEVRRLEQELEKAKKQAAKSADGVNKQLSSFGRISVYRVIRTIIKELSTGIQDSFKEVAKLSPQFNQTISSITSSLNILKGSIGSIVISVLPAIEPLLRGIALAIGWIANAIARASALLRGQQTYLKVNTDYWKKYNAEAQGALLSFDTFTTLQEQTSSVEGMFSEETLSSAKDYIKSIGETVAIISVSAVFAWLAKGKIKDFLTKVGVLKDTTAGLSKDVGNIGDGAKAAGKGFGSWANKINPAFLIIAGIAEILSGLPDLFSETATWGERLVAILKVAAGAVAVIAAAVAAIVAMKNPLSATVRIAKGIAATSLVFGALAGLVGGVINNSKNTKAFANGGMLDRKAVFTGAGTMYALAGENGAEVVARGSQGTGVANVDQIAEAEYYGTLRALYEYGAAQNGAMTFNLDMNKLGTAVARSTGFRNEANRLNPELNWK